MKNIVFILFSICLLTACRKTEANTQQIPQPLFDSSISEATRSKVIRYEIPALLEDRPELILERKAYTTSYNNATKCPNWVAWHLTKAHTYGSHKRSEEMFTEDNDVNPRATNNDYFNSRYDRGHMCPAGDNKWDHQAMQESFLFTNICPQNHKLNKYEWNKLENLCRDWARQYGAISIVCGPIYRSSSDSQAKTIGKNKVRVPDGFFKVVMRRQGDAKAIGFLFNNDGKKVSLESAIRTVDEIEKLTGIDFYPALDDKTEQRIEGEANLKDWR